MATIFDFNTPFGMVNSQPNIGPITPMTPQPAKDRTGLATMLFALGGALRGDKDFVQNTLALRQIQENKKRQQNLQQFAQTNPEFQKMFELFGKQGLQQAMQQDQAKKLADTQLNQQIKSLQGAGFNQEEINLFLAGVDPKDIIGFRQDGSLSGEQIIEDVEKNVEQTIEETNVLDTFADLDQAFGPIDAAQEGASRLTRVLGFDVDPKTGAAVRARNSLNTEILANLAADFTGRPNMLIYENIRGNLPMTAATSENDAKEKYINIKDQVDARINNLKQGLKSTTVSDSDKEKYREELNKSILLSQKLDSAILSLSGKPKDILEPDNVDFGMSGKYTGLYTNE